MFSIAAINDTDSREQWEPLGPTKEAQEFHLTQTYHEGLLKLQAKEYDKARELLETVLKDPLISNAQVDTSASDGHMLQLRFLALKNLATVSLQQGSDYYESALHCYLQAVEIDTKDSVIWNQLGTLACSMGLLSISRWAFEQGLLCSPNNWNCMEKLLEVLIAIGDEVACLSVTELILRHWPSHSRAVHVKHTIELSEPIPFAPRGIDKLEPKHVRLKFADKRKASDVNLDVHLSKKIKQNLELQLAEASWAALINALLEILFPLNRRDSEIGSELLYRSGDVELMIHLPSTSDVAMGPLQSNRLESSPVGENNPCETRNADVAKEEEANIFEEQPQERRSTRLERLRNQKPGKEELDTGGKDVAKLVLQFLKPFTFIGAENEDSDSTVDTSVSCSDQSNSLDAEHYDVAKFLRKSAKNFGAYHMGHLLLEYAASKGLIYHDALVKILDLEKLTRHWGEDRTPECSLFLAELYYDLGSSPSNSPRLNEYMSEASYHLCKIIEVVALDYPFQLTRVSENEGCSSVMGIPGTNTASANESICQNSLLESPFWIRYFWLSGRLSIFEGNKEKAQEELCVSLSLLEKKASAVEFIIHLPHCIFIRDITVDKIHHEINLLKVGFLLEKTIGKMIEKEMYTECITLLAPLILCTKEVHLDVLLQPAADKKGEMIASRELSALDTLIKSCEKTRPVDSVVYLNCHQRKLQILMAVANTGECKPLLQKLGLKKLSGSDVISKENSSEHWNYLVSEEVKAISQCVSLVKIGLYGDSNGVSDIVSIVGDIQSLLLAVMCHVASNYFLKQSSAPVIADQVLAGQKQRCCFVDAAVAFCKLQHLYPSIPVKTQVELIVAIHDLLAEYGICCAGDGSEGQDGTFLKFAIKHLLGLDMKIKSNVDSSDRETIEFDKHISQHSHVFDETEIKGTSTGENNAFDEITPERISSLTSRVKDNTGVECLLFCGDDGTIKNQEKTSDQTIESGKELTEDEREELELLIDGALDQCFFCLYGLNLRSDSSYEDDLAEHKNTSRGDYQTKEQCADVFQYILPCAKASSRTGLVKLRRVLRAIRKHFPQPPEAVLDGNAIDKFLDYPDLCEDKLSNEAGSEGYLGTITKLLLPDMGSLKEYKRSLAVSSEPYLEVYSNLYYFLAQSEETNATDKWPGFVLTKEGGEFVQQNANLFRYDLLYNPLRFESWQRLANIYDEEVDLLLNDGSKHINVAGWRKNATLPQRVEMSRRRSRRCLLMSLALANTPAQQCEIHELLALVYYDSLQNVVPLYDQRSVIPSKDAAWMMFCENSLRHFKRAFTHKQDWSHAFYMGKLCEKLGYSHEISLSYYDKAIALNPSAVDSVYRMHASRLKILCAHGKQNMEALKVVLGYCFSQPTKVAVTNILTSVSPETSQLPDDVMDRSCQVSSERKREESVQMEEMWHILYNDCLAALKNCVEGDLKHFHKARYMLAQGRYKRGLSGDLERAKDELSFCFKSARSSFTINMWEIDGMVKKGRRKTAGCSVNKKALEVNLPESSRKFITCIRKYLLFYLKLLEETGEVSTLDRAYVSLRADKRFSLCIEDVVPVALGRYIKALISSTHQAETIDSGAMSCCEHHLEKIFALFMEQGTLWPEICVLHETRSPGFSESSLYGFLHEYIFSLEKDGKLDTLEMINEKIRKRFKNPKLSNGNNAKVCRHASIAWYRSLIISLALITPLQSGLSSEIQVFNPSDSGLDNRLLYIDLQVNELWTSFFEDSSKYESLETKWSPVLSKIKNIGIRKASDENLEMANSLLKSSYNFYRESSCIMFPSGVNLYLVPFRLVTGAQFQLGMDGVEVLDISIPRKLLLWAYTLLHGRCANISVAIKHCEEIAKKLKKTAGTASVSSNSSVTNTPTSHTGSGKDGINQGGESEAEVSTGAAVAAIPALDWESARYLNPPPLSSSEQIGLSAVSQLHHCNTVTQLSTAVHGAEDPDKSHKTQPDPQQNAGN
ncbi:calcineurin-binding protein 1 isoform X1 [Tripterygium wilfordii]|uniref:calcineurin-binding protein 1 isoform X1 n=1 Tax=Tripterygium wilfordii TaxID=458696 RepID=UPI0018F85788|nr:calcineurin-binding protein 1 isoform X1 [Tripterygium wilfordii]